MKPDPATGLRAWTRDSAIPAQAGDPGLCPRPEAEVADLLREHLLRPSAPPLVSVSWEYARWKPSVSVTCAYRLTFADESFDLAVLKHYRGDKARILAQRGGDDPAPPGLSPRLRARALLPAERTALFAPPADRELGLRYLLDPERFAKLVRDGGIAAQGLVRRRKTVFELLRYKPERRAVYRVRLALRDEARTKFSLATRVLPSAEAARVIAARLAFEAAGGRELAPPLACHHARHGLLVEPWLALDPTSPAEFDSAPRAGRLLARLHALPGRPPSVADARPALSGLAPLFGPDPDVERALGGLVWPEGGEDRGWIHGDFHPDQTAECERGPTLLDLDALGAGDPARDLANWVADHLYELPETSFDDAAGPLLEAYREAGGADPGPTRLRQYCACELARRGAASLRRLERGAGSRARAALRRAVELQG